MKKKDISKQIELKRLELKNKVKKFGFESYEALNCSKELDSLIASYQKKIESN